MQLVSGTIIDGRVVVEGLALPEGTVVTVLTHDDKVTAHLSKSNEAELLEALDDADRKEGISAKELFNRLRHFG